MRGAWVGEGVADLVPNLQPVHHDELSSSREDRGAVGESRRTGHAHDVGLRRAQALVRADAPGLSHPGAADRFQGIRRDESEMGDLSEPVAPHQQALQRPGGSVHQLDAGAVVGEGDGVAVGDRGVHHRTVEGSLGEHVGAGLAVGDAVRRGSDDQVA